MKLFFKACCVVGFLLIIGLPRAWGQNDTLLYKTCQAEMEGLNIMLRTNGVSSAYYVTKSGDSTRIWTATKGRIDRNGQKMDHSIIGVHLCTNAYKNGKLYVYLKYYPDLLEGEPLDVYVVMSYIRTASPDGSNGPSVRKTIEYSLSKNKITHVESLSKREARKYSKYFWEELQGNEIITSVFGA